MRVLRGMTAHALLKRRCSDFSFLIRSRSNISYIHPLPPFDSPQKCLCRGFNALQGCEVKVKIMCPLPRFPFELFDCREGLLLVPRRKINFRVLLQKCLSPDSDLSNKNQGSHWGRRNHEDLARLFPNPGVPSGDDRHLILEVRHLVYVPLASSREARPDECDSYRDDVPGRNDHVVI